jgi:UDP-3-O-[3-hydroxymyristoyl] glucosamine N-acyltransferase
MIFIVHADRVGEVAKTRASVVVVPPKAVDQVASALDCKTFLISDQVSVAMAKVINRYFFPTPYVPDSVSGIHSTAVVDQTANLAQDVRVGPYAVVGARVTIGLGSVAGAHSVIEPDVRIGMRTVIHPMVYVGHSCVIGNDCEIKPHASVGTEGFGYADDRDGSHYRIPHQGIVVLEDDVHIGANCTIDRGTFGETRVGAGTKIDNQCHVGHNCTIGRNALITAHFVMGGSSEIGDNFVCGGKTSVTGHIQVGNDIQVAALSAIHKTLLEPGRYGGYPLQPMQEYMKTRATMSHLPEMRKQLQKLMKKVFGRD